MTAILYPVAESAETALAAPKGFAAREREAARIAQTRVEFVTAMVGPAFATRESALDAYAGQVDDDRPGSDAVAAAAHWRRLCPVSAAPAGPHAPPPDPVRPSYADGRRWPLARASPTPSTAWRLSVSFWRVIAAEVETAGSASHKRRRGGADRSLDGLSLDALTRQPLRPTRPQQPLDIGLFEVRLPESPDTFMPDE